MSVTPPDDPDFSRLFDAARPLSKAERSLIKVFKSELRYRQQFHREVNSNTHMYKPAYDLSFQMRNYKHLVLFSELLPSKFWQIGTRCSFEPATTWDKFINPIGVILSEVSAPAYFDYAQSLQELAMYTSLLWGWSELLNTGKDNRNLLASAAPDGWSWEWQDASLCLIAPVSAPWVDQVSDICLSRNDTAG